NQTEGVCAYESREAGDGSRESGVGSESLVRVHMISLPIFNNQNTIRCKINSTGSTNSKISLQFFNLGLEDSSITNFCPSAAQICNLKFYLIRQANFYASSIL
ncbi:hypothetical protein Ccrd_014922, partial [Cynara cardunculus var. scolymus]